MAIGALGSIEHRKKGATDAGVPQSSPPGGAIDRHSHPGCSRSTPGCSPVVRALADPHDPWAHQFNGAFLPSLYMYSVIAGFFSSPSASKPILVVTPVRLVWPSSGV
jgi:hypothetical protein